MAEHRDGCPHPHGACTCHPFELGFQPQKPWQSAVPIQWHVMSCPVCLGAARRSDAIPIDLCTMCKGHGLVRRRYDLNELEELA